MKGWAIRNAAAIIAASGARDFFVDAGGDIQSSGRNAAGKEWSVGIRNPFDAEEIIKVVYPRGRGIATSGTYVRGQHIYDPHAPGRPIVDIVSLTVIGPDVLEADRFATAAFAMGRAGIFFIEETPGLEGYIVDSKRPRHPDQRLRSLLRAMIEAHRPAPRPHHHVPAGALLPDRRCSSPRSCSAPSASCRTIPMAIAFSTALILAACWITNRVFARVFDVPANSESIYITALILVAHSRSGGADRPRGDRRPGLRLACGRWRRNSSSRSAGKHLFNPAAFGVRAARVPARPAGDLVGRRQSAAPARRARRRPPPRPQAAALRPRGDLRPRRPRDGSRDRRAVAIRHGAPRDASFVAALLLRLRHADRAADRARRCACRGSPSPRSSGSCSPRTSISARSTSRRSWRSSSAISSPMRSSPKGRFVLTLERIEQSAADSYDFVFQFAAQARLPGRAVSRMDARARPRRQPRQSPLFHGRLGPDRGYGSPRREILSGVERLQARARRRWRPATRSMPRSSPATSPCRPIPTPSSPSSPAASASRRSAACCNTCSTARKRGRSSSSTATSARQDIAYRDVLDAAERELGIRTIYAVAAGATRGQYPGPHRRAARAPRDPRLSRAHLLHLRPAGDGEGAPPACCTQWAFAARGSRSTSFPGLHSAKRFPVETKEEPHKGKRSTRPTQPI